jgi:hypothetical protein
MQKDSQAGAIDIAKLGEVRNDLHFSLIEEGSNFFENRLNVCRIQVTCKPDNLGIVPAFNGFTGELDF